ncbi:energy-coupling factor transporter transmembrane protein EcfT [Paenibacillus sp. NAIST15-1]|uniref:energy-coupling factor transporter transmembrane component T family protein n=1 Tax=Paenibacillus sp. NAIST15-1 TaxID=1605994 RepID=UPI00086B8B98|nr:energy-coupling factor transporter transmembrane component T [Paenibacillus sp. NAIST15-1]GAV15854.1 ABC transporter permease [Paenibacillus sp. NAIST15-1]
MAEAFDSARHITIGQYMPGRSLIHQWDSRYKLAAFTLYIGAVAFCQSYAGNIAGLAISLFIVFLARIPIGYALKGLKPALPFLLILALLQLLFNGKVYANGQVYWQYGFIWLTEGGVRLVIVSTMRFVDMMLLVSVLTLTTTTTQLARAMHSLLRPLEKMKVPVHAFCMMITIALRFVPTFALEMDKIRKAQAARGASFGTIPWWRIIKRTQSVFPLIIPLFQLALQRAEQLIAAMESRGYRSHGRTSFRSFEARTADVMLLFVAVGAAYLLIWL